LANTTEALCRGATRPAPSLGLLGFRSVNGPPASVSGSPPVWHDRPMLITCTNCGTSYQVAAASLGPTGRSVRCARCKQTWFAANIEALADVAEAHRSDLAGITEAPAYPGPEQYFAPAPDIPSQSGPAGLPLGDDAGVSPPAWPSSEPAAEDQMQDQETDLPPVIDAPPIAPTDHVPTPAEDIESVAARRAQRQAAHRRRWERSMWTSGILTLVAVNLMLIGWRSNVVRYLPQTASLYAAIGLPVNLRGLVFANVTTERESNDGVEVLVVKGLIVNDFKRAAEVPRLRFSLRYQSGYEVYSWTALPNRNVLLPGESLSFTSRLASPPREGERVEVRFFNRRDLSAELP
jgi:predicted Zn finger-like uncharacterized protein